MIDTVILHFGYVERSKSASLICTLDKKLNFSSEEEALKSLAKDLLSKYKQDFMYDPADRFCCKKSLLDSENQFCPKCGSPLTKYKFSLDLFKDWLLSLLSMGLDDLGHNMYCEGRELDWLIGDSPFCLVGKDIEEVCLVTESAEDMIPYVLGLTNG